MILYEDRTFDPLVTHQRLAVLEAMSEAMKCHCFSTVDALEAYLDQGLAEMRTFTGNPQQGLTKIALVFSSPRAVEVVSRRMQPGCDFAAWPQPDAWLSLYQQIDALRERARAHNPQFAPRYL